MLTRIYINNFRCLVAFEMRFNEAALLCGMNGSGKSAVFDAVKLVRDLAAGNCFLGYADDESKRTVSRLEFCKWLASDIQEFELEFEDDGSKYIYILHVQQVADYEQPRILKEVIRCDGEELLTRDLISIRFEKDKSFFFSWNQSALSVFQPSNSQKGIKTLQRLLSNLIILRPNARMFENESRFESSRVNLDMGNIISWYRYHSQDLDWTDVLRRSLQAVWPVDFRSLKLTDAGALIKQLEFNFTDTMINFKQLSDGEKMLVALYMIHAVLSTATENLTVFIDEPDSFISLQELQPWLLEMLEIVENSKQLLIISHNIEIIESSTSDISYFYRDNHTSPTRVTPLRVPEGLSVREALARGWVNN